MVTSNSIQPEENYNEKSYFHSHRNWLYFYPTRGAGSASCGDYVKSRKENDMSLRIYFI
jgi:hypothetical protein